MPLSSEDTQAYAKLIGDYPGDGAADFLSVAMEKELPAVTAHRQMLFNAHKSYLGGNPAILNELGIKPEEADSKLLSPLRLFRGQAALTGGPSAKMFFGEDKPLLSPSDVTPPQFYPFGEDLEARMKEHGPVSTAMSLVGQAISSPIREAGQRITAAEMQAALTNAAQRLKETGKSGLRPEWDTALKASQKGDTSELTKLATSRGLAMSEVMTAFPEGFYGGGAGEMPPDVSRALQEQDSAGLAKGLTSAGQYAQWAALLGHLGQSAIAGYKGPGLAAPSEPNIPGPEVRPPSGGTPWQPTVRIPEPSGMRTLQGKIPLGSGEGVNEEFPSVPQERPNVRTSIQQLTTAPGMIKEPAGGPTSVNEEFPQAPEEPPAPPSSVVKGQKLQAFGDEQMRSKMNLIKSLQDQINALKQEGGTKSIQGEKEVSPYEEEQAMSMAAKQPAKENFDAGDNVKPSSAEPMSPEDSAHLQSLANEVGDIIRKGGHPSLTGVGEDTPEYAGKELPGDLIDALLSNLEPTKEPKTSASSNISDSDIEQLFRSAGVPEEQLKSGLGRLVKKAGVPISAEERGQFFGKKSGGTSGTTLGSFPGQLTAKMLRSVNLANYLPAKAQRILNVGEASYQATGKSMMRFQGKLSEIGDSIDSAAKNGASGDELQEMHRVGVNRALNAFKQDLIDRGFKPSKAEHLITINKDVGDALNVLNKWIQTRKTLSVALAPGAVASDFATELDAMSKAGHNPLTWHKYGKAYFQSKHGLLADTNPVLDEMFKIGRSNGMEGTPFMKSTASNETIRAVLRKEGLEGASTGKEVLTKMVDLASKGTQWGYKAYDLSLVSARANSYIQELAQLGVNEKNWASMTPEAKNSAANKAAWMTDQFYQNYGRTAGGEVGSRAGLETPAVKALLNPAFKYPLEMIRTDKNAMLMRPVPYLASRGLQLTLAALGAKIAATQVPLTQKQQTRSLIPMGKGNAPLAYDYFQPTIGMISGYDKDIGKGKFDNAGKALGKAVDEIFTNGALTSTFDSEPRAGSKAVFNVLANHPASREAWADALQTPAGKFTGLSGASKFLRAGTTRPGEKEPDLIRDAEGIANLQQVGRPQSIFNKGAPQREQQKLNSADMKIINDIMNMHNHPSWLQSDRLSNAAPLIERIKERNKAYQEVPKP